MNDLRNRLVRLLQDPRVAATLQNPRVQRAAFRILRFRGRVQEQTDRVLDRAARRLNLATAREVRELRRTIRRLEEELKISTRDE